MIALHAGDCRDVLAALEADSIEACVTDPPYEISFMSRKWDGTGTSFQPDTWLAVRRVLKPGGYMVAFASTRGYHRMVCAIEDAGFIIHPMLGWVNGQGFPKATSLSKQIDRQFGIANTQGRRFNLAGDGDRSSGGDVCRSDHPNYAPHAPTTPEAQQWDGWAYGLQSLKPGLEPICLAQKPAIREGMVANVLKHDTGALNIDASRVAVNITEMQGRSGASTPNNVGRWPPNLLHDGSDEVEAAFAAFGTRASGVGAVKRASAGENSGNTGSALGQESRPAGTVMIEYGDIGSVSRFFPSCPFTEDELRIHYTAKADKADRADSKHPTIKPVSLLVWLTKLVCPPGGTIIDPFAGSGTTGEAAMLNGFNAILAERDPQHVADIQHRIKRWSGEDLPLFSEAAG